MKKNNKGGTAREEMREGNERRETGVPFRRVSFYLKSSLLSASYCTSCVEMYHVISFQNMKE